MLLCGLRVRSHSAFCEKIWLEVYFCPIRYTPAALTPPLRYTVKSRFLPLLSWVSALNEPALQMHSKSFPLLPRMQHISPTARLADTTPVLCFYTLHQGTSLAGLVYQTIRTANVCMPLARRPRDSLVLQICMSTVPPVVSRRSFLAAATALTLGSLLSGAGHHDVLATMYSSDTSRDKKYASASEPNTKLNDLMPQIRDGLEVLLNLQTHWTEKTAALDGDGTLTLLFPKFLY